uniref:Uncharacterized protein n=1 Tax=Pavo cristatus TaxID=9049 RepID=A0A8C9FLG6_PAVCR
MQEAAMWAAALLLLLCPPALAGRFWHITDLHWDPGYEAAVAAGQRCPSGGSEATPGAGPWGSYLCDAPWSLLSSAVLAMRPPPPRHRGCVSSSAASRSRG